MAASNPPGTGKVHSTIEFPEDLSSTFTSESLTDDIAANFPGVSIMKDTVSSLLHVFGPDRESVDNTVYHLRNFIAELCLQKIYSDVGSSETENQHRNVVENSNNIKRSSSAPRSGSASSSDDSNGNSNDPIGLEIRLKDHATDITEEEIRENFQWMEALEIECPKDKDANFLTGTVYVKFKTRRGCSMARENLASFYPNYESSTISRGSWDSLVLNRKREQKRHVFTVSDPDVLDQYLKRHESDDGSDTEQLKKDAVSRRNILQRKDKPQQQVPRPRSSDLPSSSRRPASPPHPAYNAPSSKRNFAGGGGNAYGGGDSNRDHFDGGRGTGRRVLSSRSPYFQPQQPSAIPPVPRNPRFRPIAIDGNNLCMHHGNHQFYSCLGLEIAINYFLSHGHTEVYAFIPEMKIRCLPQNQTPRIERQDILHRLEGERRLTVIPRKKMADGSKVNPYDDVLIVKFAFERKGVIISNDNMIDVGRDNPKYRNYIDKWRITFCFAGDHFMLIDDPNGRTGMRAEDMLIADDS